MMRRVHTFEAVDLAKIISAYGHLIRQKKVPLSTGNTSLIKTMEHVLQNKWSTFSSNVSEN